MSGGVKELLRERSGLKLLSNGSNQFLEACSHVPCHVRASLNYTLAQKGEKRTFIMNNRALQPQER
jgi:hypothetical protein